MDPFTEKLLERTRARRENLQKKMAERPNASNRPMVKRVREPLVESNSVPQTIPAADTVPQASTKPSPSKRSRSGENLQPPASVENQEPPATLSLAPLLPDPPTDKKPPSGPANSRSSSSRSSTSMERTSLQRTPIQPQQEKVPQVPDAPISSKEPETLSLHREEEPITSSAGMKSRLQRLAEQRKGWEGDALADAVEDQVPPSLKRHIEAPEVSVPPCSSATPVGRRGRLANLAATIGSWEDDLSHANIPKETSKEKTVTPKFGARETTVASSSGGGVVISSSAPSSKATISSVQATKPSGVPPNPQKANLSAPMASAQPLPSPQKSSAQAPATSNPSSLSSSTAGPQSPGKNFIPSRGLNTPSSPQKPQLRPKPLDAPPTPQEKTVAGAPPTIKSFLERFEERCHDRSNHSSPTRTMAATITTPSVTPNTRLVQERLRTAQASSTATADLTQRHKMERESELAMIRNRFQKGNNMWKSNEEKTVTNTTDKVSQQPPDTEEQVKKPVEGEVCDRHDEAREEPANKTITPPDVELIKSPPAAASSPLRVLPPPAEKVTEERREEVIREVEMSVDSSINSAVITELFDGALEQSEDQSDEEEDALNISSMSLLTPLAETVAAVVKSPERRGMMTSTPANSFLVKNSSNKPTKFQKTNLRRSMSSDSVDTLDDDHRLPYSVDAYRSIRVKETERPGVKQVIVRKEDVAHRAEEPRGAALFNIKQKMKILTSEMNLQQTVIHQASQALNCCTDEEHGKGSQVEAEAERLLLVATERREALKKELERLRGDPQRKNPEPSGPSASKGSISLQELRLPLKADFVCSTANRPESTKHSFFIMIRAGAENTVATALASTHRGLSGDTLTFPTKFTVSDVSSDFEIDIEVYCLVQKREVCSDKKKKASKSKAITPKRFLAITKTAQTPVVASPGGPHAVRTSNFLLVGSHKLTLSSIGKSKFPLEKIKYEGSERELLRDMFQNKVPFLCPLEGHVFLKMQCEVGSKVEERGFLTMFEDVSGFGAWHRRWCVLSGYCISYWTYPDDERRKNPIGRINLASCSSPAVAPANREFCARPNTMELVTVRPQREDDRETLVSQFTDTMCVTKNWLSADTKEERNLWMRKLNQILMDLRMWQPESCYRPQ